MKAPEGSEQEKIRDQKSSHVQLGPGGEFDRIRSIWNALGETAYPSGDDCVFIDLPNICLAVSNDLTIENTHFFPGWLSLEEIGWRAAMTAFSDLAAVAAEPLGVQVGLGLSTELSESAAAEIMTGVGDAAKMVGAKVWGGDLVQSELLVIDATVFGIVNGEPVRRSTAQAGNVLAVTGTLGGPAQALDDWLDGEEPDTEARSRFAKPVARIQEAIWLKQAGAAAMIDISDGLFADTTHLASASKLSAVIDLNRVPVHVSAFTPLEAVRSGEEYELLVALPEKDADSIARDFSDKFGLPLTVVGRVESGSGVRVVDDGNPVEDLITFQHF